MEARNRVGFVLLAICVFAFVNNVMGDDSSPEVLIKKVKGKKVCDQGWECKGWSEYCCNQTISKYFQTYNFEDLFSKRNSPVAHAAGFWDYRSFILAAAVYQPHGFGTTGGKKMQTKEIAAFLGHVGSKTSCKLVLIGSFLRGHIYLTQNDYSLVRIVFDKCKFDMDPTF